MFKKRGFTLGEILIAFAIIGVLTLLSMFSFSRLAPKVDKFKFKNANLSFKHAVSALLSNNAYYSEDSGLTDTDYIEFTDKHTNKNISFGGEEKFRHLLLRELGVPVVGDAINCYMLVNSIEPVPKKLCYRAENGVIWGIPDTNFVNKGVISQKNATGGTSKYAPVTIYIDNSRYDSKIGYYKGAVTLGLRADGAIALINVVDDCSKEDTKQYVQCNVEELFASLNQKFTE